MSRRHPSKCELRVQRSRLISILFRPLTRRRFANMNPECYSTPTLLPNWSKYKLQAGRSRRRPICFHRLKMQRHSNPKTARCSMSKWPPNPSKYRSVREFRSVLDRLPPQVWFHQPTKRPRTKDTLAWWLAAKYLPNLSRYKCHPMRLP